MGAPSAAKVIVTNGSDGVAAAPERVAGEIVRLSVAAPKRTVTVAVGVPCPLYP